MIGFLFGAALLLLATLTLLLVSDLHRWERRKQGRWREDYFDLRSRIHAIVPREVITAHDEARVARVKRSAPRA